ncbi:hypothetical protein [Paractinoplanes hotanensis]|uniref:Uncharacterized protein n=1 Tax=Paractinoplanes hotanensis TaxID=2906497 RepID=A0ABT0Y052_9ACTN|nr:hypothetical protein [Actinoplanes hotanensis]MCM4079406.1 hypothetical protein [Actinoplanes hotanensis]
MAKPHLRPPMTPAQKDTSDDQPEALPAQVFGVVTAGGRCPACGKVVTDVNAEPLDYREQEDGSLLVESVVFVVLPCGHDFTRRVELR